MINLPCRVRESLLQIAVCSKFKHCVSIIVSHYKNKYKVGIIAGLKTNKNFLTRTNPQIFTQNAMTESVTTHRLPSLDQTLR